MRVLILAILLLMAVPAQAQDVSGLFCPALQDEKTYEGRYDSYRMLVPGKNGWIYRTRSDLKDSFSIGEESLQLLLSLQNALKARGVEFVLLYPPTRGMAHPEFIDFNADAVWPQYTAEIAQMQAAGLHVVGLQRPATGTDFFYKRDHHWSAAGAKTSALALTEFIKTQEFYGGLAKTEFVTKESGTRDYSGTFGKVFKAVCNVKLPPETIKVLETSRVQTAQGQDDLFGDAASPEIVLAGTSNGTHQIGANFEGFLKEALSADVLNVSQAGAGVDGPLMDYLRSPHYREGKAKMLIWEVPGYYDLNNIRSLLRQAISAAELKE